MMRQRINSICFWNKGYCRISISWTGLDRSRPARFWNSRLFVQTLCLECMNQYVVLLSAFSVSLPPLGLLISAILLSRISYLLDVFDFFSVFLFFLVLSLTAFNSYSLFLFSCLFSNLFYFFNMYFLFSLSRFHEDYLSQWCLSEVSPFI